MRVQGLVSVPGLRALVVAALASTILACGPAVPPLAHSFSSVDALARAALTALERRDAAGLRALGLNVSEFRDHVWPDLPAARPERNLPMEYVWGDLQQKSNLSLERTLARQGGRRYELVGVRFLGETSRYGSYLVHRKAELVVRNEAGRVRPVRLFGSVLSKQGAVKIFSFVVED